MSSDIYRVITLKEGKYMKEIDIRIQELNKTICENIDLIDFASRGLISQNVLAQCRNLVEHIAMKAYSVEHELVVGYIDIKAALDFIKTDNKYLFMRKFHTFLQESRSHYGSSHEGAERLILKYYKYLLELRNFAKEQYNLVILENLEKFPVNMDRTIQEYYEKIIETLKVNRPIVQFNKGERFYVKKIKSFVVFGKVYYENTLTPVGDNIIKMDRFIVFSKKMIPYHYAINASIFMDEIEIRGKKMPVNILGDFRVSIRPCELNNFAKFFGAGIKMDSSSAEYMGIMNYLTKSGASLTDIVRMSEAAYQNVRSIMTARAKTVKFLHILDMCRQMVLGEGPGSNTLAYLLATLNNRVLKLQYYHEANKRLAGLFLKWGCIPFDDMPFASSLIRHTPEVSELYGCISINGREHELFGRYIQTNSKQNGKIYTEVTDVESYGEVESLRERYNKKVYSGHQERCIHKFGKDKLYIEEDVKNTEFIIRELIKMSEKGVIGYEEAISSWMLESNKVDSDEKKDILRKMFENSHVALIYGAAGTGKTYLINHISQYFDNRRKLYLSNTHPAVENLRRNVTAQNAEFSTVKSFISKYYQDTEYDILIVDECSMISNSDMKSVLEKIKCKLIVLAGDIYQIESIEFGNWFEMARCFIKKDAWCELQTPYRTKKNDLLIFWKKVRNLDEDITEHIVQYRYSSDLDASLFEKNSDDEIILCLNYDGLYGINNINRFLQNGNVNSPYKLGVWSYKVGDPVLFNESNRFAPVLYNNLKGTIVKIEPVEVGVYFSIEIDKAITEWDADDVGLELVEPIHTGKSVVRFFVHSPRDTDEDIQDKETIVPFQVSYAVSIHKAQGLEYDSVKIVITEEVDEMISLNIFYTAITRTKNKLKIYWSAESQEKIISGLKKVNISNEATIFAAQTGLRCIRNRR